MVDIYPVATCPLTVTLMGPLDAATGTEVTIRVVHAVSTTERLPLNLTVFEF